MTSKIRPNSKPFRIRWNFLLNLIFLFSNFSPLVIPRSYPSISYVSETRVSSEPLKLFTGATKFLNPKRNLVIENIENAICEVTVLNSNYKNLNSPGRLHPSSFPCNFTNNEVSYINFGVEKNDRIPLQIRYDTDDDVFIERVNLNIEVKPGHYITNPLKNVALQQGQRLRLRPELLGISDQLDKSNCQFTILKRGLNSFTDMGIFDGDRFKTTGNNDDFDSTIDIAWPRYGEIKGVVPGKYYDCDSRSFETIGNEIIYQHQNNGRTLNFDKIPVHLIFTQQDSRLHDLLKGEIDGDEYYNPMDSDLDGAYDDFTGSRRTRSSPKDKMLSEFVYIELKVLDAPVNTPPKIFPNQGNAHVLEFNEHTITPLTQDLLYAYDEETDYSNQIQYTILSENFLKSVDRNGIPNSFAHGYIANTNDMNEPISQFGQDEIDDFQIIFVPPANSQNVNWPQSIKLKVSDDMGASKDIFLTLNLRPSSTYAPVVKVNKGIKLYEGQSRPICGDELQFFAHNTSITLHWLNGTRYGQLIYNSQPVTRNTVIDLTEISQNCGSLVYQHDTSWEHPASDNMIFKAKDRQDNEIIFLFPVSIVALDDHAPILAVNREQSMVMGSDLLIRKSMLSAKDPDSADSSISFILSEKPKYGKLLQVSNKNKRGQEVTQWKQFSTCAGSLYYQSDRKHFTRPVQEILRFTLSDARGNKGDIEYEFVINITPEDRSAPEKCKSRFEKIRVIGGQRHQMTKNHLCYFDNFSENTGITIFTSNNCNGHFYSKVLEDNVKSFSQDLIDYKKIEFLAPKIIKRSIQCMVILRICDEKSQCRNDKIEIEILPENRNPPLVTTSKLVSKNGREAVISRKNIEISDSDSDDYDLEIEITQMPKHGYIVPRQLKSRMMSDSDRNGGRLRHLLNLQDIRNQNLQYQPYESYQESFRRESTEKNFKPDIIRPSKDSFAIKVTDGKNVIYETVNIEYKWDQIGLPENLSDFRTECSEGDRVLLDRKFLKSNNSELLYEIGQSPSKGHLVRIDRSTGNQEDIFRFTQNDVDQEMIFYFHEEGGEVGKSFVTDTFELIVQNIKNVPIIVVVDIQPVDNTAPVVKNPSIALTVKESIPMQLPLIDISDEDTILSEVFCNIIQQPKHGIIDNTSPAPGSEISREGKRIFQFTAMDSKNGLLRYNPLDLHTNDKEPLRDSLQYSCQDKAGNEAVNSPFIISIEILPENDETPVLVTKPIQVQEGKTKKVTAENIHCTDADRYHNRPQHNKEDNLYISFIELPYTGKIIFPSKIVNKTRSFKNNFDFNLRSGRPGMNARNSNSYVTDAPYQSAFVDLTANFVETTSSFMDDYESNYINDDDDYFEDYEDEDTFEEIRGKRGAESKSDYIAQTTFTYASANTLIPYDVVKNGNLYYVHNSKEEFQDNFKVQCFDDAANNRHKSEIRSIDVNIIPVNDEAPRMTINSGLFLGSNERREIIATMLSATDKDTDDEEILYMLTLVPERGYLAKVTAANNAEIKLEKHMNFTQADINNQKIVYIHDPELAENLGNQEDEDNASVDLQSTDRFKFDLYDGRNRNSNKYFNIQIRGKDRIFPEVVNKGLTLPEGGRVKITSELLSTHDMNSKDIDLTFNVIKEPRNGKLVNTDNMQDPISNTPSINSFSQLELIGNKIQYIHTDNSEQRTDSFDFTVSDGSNYIHRTFKVTIINVNNKIPHIEILSDIRCNEGESFTITPYEIKVTDNDTPLSNIVFRIKKHPRYGRLSLESNSYNQLSSFTMQDIKNSKVVYRHDGSENNQDYFEFTVSDGTNDEVLYDSSTLMSTTFGVFQSEFPGHFI